MRILIKEFWVRSLYSRLLPRLLSTESLKKSSFQCLTSLPSLKLDKIPSSADLDFASHKYQIDQAQALIHARTWAKSVDPFFQHKSTSLFSERSLWDYSFTFLSTLQLANEHDHILHTLSLDEITKRLLFFVTYYVPDDYYGKWEVKTLLNFLLSYEVGASFKYKYDSQALKYIYFLKLWNEIIDKPTWRNIRVMEAFKGYMSRFWRLITLFKLFRAGELFKDIKGHTVLSTDELASKVFIFFLWYFQRIYWEDYTDIIYEYEESFRQCFSVEKSSILPNADLFNGLNILDLSYIYFVNMQFQLFYEKLICSSVDYTRCLLKLNKIFDYDVELSENYVAPWDFEYLSDFSRPHLTRIPEIVKTIKKEDKHAKLSFSRTSLTWQELWDMRVAQLDRELALIRAKQSTPAPRSDGSKN